MTTPPFNTTPDPLDPPPPPGPTSTPIGDEIARDQAFETTQPPSSVGGDATGTTEDVKDKAQDVKDKAQDALGSVSEQGSQVAGTAKDEALSVAAEAKDKATDLLADVKAEVDEQSKAQLQGLASKLGELADEIENLVTGSDATGTVADVAQQLADKTHELSSHLESRQPLDLLEDVRGFARRRPAAFLAGAAVAGVVAGRLTRGAKASQDAGPAQGSASAPSAPATAPAPTSTSTTTSTFPSDGGLATEASAGDPGYVPPGQNTGGRL